MNKKRSALIAVSIIVPLSVLYLFFFKPYTHDASGEHARTAGRTAENRREGNLSTQKEMKKLQIVPAPSESFKSTPIFALQAYIPSVLSEEHVPGEESAEDRGYPASKEELEAIIRNAAYQDLPIELGTIGLLKEYFISNNNLSEYRGFLESLPDSFEMKIEMLGDLALLYQEREQIDDSIALLESIEDKNDNVRLKYIKSDVYWWSGEPALAATSLLEASQISPEVYQYTRLSQISESKGDLADASYYTELADALKSTMHHDE